MIRFVDGDRVRRVDLLDFFRFQCPLLRLALIGADSNATTTVQLRSYFDQQFVLTDRQGQFWSQPDLDGCNLCPPTVNAACQPYTLSNLRDQSVYLIQYVVVLGLSLS